MLIGGEERIQGVWCFKEVYLSADSDDIVGKHLYEYSKNPIYIKTVLGVVYKFNG